MKPDNLMADTGPVSAAPTFLAGGGELGALMRTYRLGRDAARPAAELAAEPEDGRPHHADLAPADLDRLGPRPRSISTTIPTSRSSAASIRGRSAGRPTEVVWREIWDDIAPMLDSAHAAATKEPSSKQQLLIMERNGYPEETYYTFSYSPIPDDDGSVGGIICANSDDTRARRRRAAA